MKPGVEVADILRLHLKDYQKKYRLHPDHYKVVYDILNCRTEYLGGHIERCDVCGASSGPPIIPAGTGIVPNVRP